MTFSLSSVTVLDGSMGQYLNERGVPKDSKIWSARSIVEEQYHPIVIDTHAEYIRAGAKVITTNNYAIQPSYYASVFDDWEARIPRDTELAVKLAKEARRRCGAEETVRIFGCLPPLCQTFRPDLTEQFIQEHGRDACIAVYRQIAQALIRGGVDGLLGETLNGWQEARLVVEATKDLEVPLVVCLEGTLRGKDLKPAPHRAPEVVKELLAAKRAGAPIEAIGFNCAPPDVILEALRAVDASGLRKELSIEGVHLAAYANCNDTAEFHGKGFDLEVLEGVELELRQDCISSEYVDWCREWIIMGATYCGGCCGTTPVHIKALTEALAKQIGEPSTASQSTMPPSRSRSRSRSRSHSLFFSLSKIYSGDSSGDDCKCGCVKDETIGREDVAKTVTTEQSF